MSPQVSHYRQNRPEFKLERARKLGLGPEPVEGDIHSGSVEAVQQPELRTGLGQFVAVEIAGRIAFAVVEAAGSTGSRNHLLEPDPRDDDVAEGLEIKRTVGQCDVRFVRAQQCGGDLVHASPRRIQLSGKLCGLVAEHNGFGDGVRYFGAENPQSGAVALANLPAKQIQTLYAVGAFMNRVKAVVAVVLLDVA